MAKVRITTGARVRFRARVRSRVMAWARLRAFVTFRTKRALGLELGLYPVLSIGLRLRQV